MTSGLDVAGLIRNHQAGVWRYLRVLGCDAAEAEELAQETFLAVLQSPFQDYHPAATAAYLRKVARNLFVSARRRVARQAPEVTLSNAELDALDTDWSRWAGQDGGEAMLAALEACLQGLNERARLALDLRFRRQESRAAIAAALELSEHGAKNLLQRAKEQLRVCIERKLQ